MAKNVQIQAFKKHINLLGFIAAILVTFITHFLMIYIISSLRTAVLWKQYTWFIEFLEGFNNAMISVANFVIYALIINNMLRFGFKKSGVIISYAVLRIVLFFVAAMAFGIYGSKDFMENLVFNFVYFLFVNSVEILLLIGSIVLIAFLRSKYIDEKNTDITVRKWISVKNPLTVITFWVNILISTVYLSGRIAQTYSDVFDGGHGVFELVAPYIGIVANFFLGYVIMIAVAKWLDLQWKNILTAEKPKKK